MKERAMPIYRLCRGCSLRFSAEDPSENFCRSCVNMGLPQLPLLGGHPDAPSATRCFDCGAALPGRPTGKLRICPECKKRKAASRKIVQGTARSKVIFSRRCMQCGELFQSKGARTLTCPACTVRMKGRDPHAKIHCKACGKLYWQETPDSRICGRCRATQGEELAKQ